MNPWAAFVLGLLIGWLIEWIIDWVYWRRKRQETDTAQASRQAAVIINSDENLDLFGQVSALKTDKQQLQNELQRKDSQIAELEAQLHAAQKQSRDNLLSLPGVNAGMTQRMYQAGLLTFQDVGALRPTRLKEILGDTIPQGAQEAEIIKQARIAAGSLSKIDDLEVIVGIGPAIARILNESCIYTFADLAALTVEELRSIVGERIQRLADEDKLLAQARDLAGKQS